MAWFVAFAGESVKWIHGGRRFCSFANGVFGEKLRVKRAAYADPLWLRPRNKASFVMK
jgi:hypothetical protein